MRGSIIGITGQSKATTDLDVRRPAEIVALTSLRGYLAVWVVAYHFWNDVLKLFPTMGVLSPFVRAGQMAVPAFFMLSGFVLSYNYSDRFYRLNASSIFRFQAARLARIYPVHLVTLLMVAAMVWVSEIAGYQLTDSGYSTRDFILNLFLVQTWVPDFKLNWNYPSWSISSEWFAYILFPFVVTGVLRFLTSPPRALIFSGLSLAASIAVMTSWAPRAFYHLALVVPTFLAGIGVYSTLQSLPALGKSTPSPWLPEMLVLMAVLSTMMFTQTVVVVSFLSCTLGLIGMLAWLGDKCHWLWSLRPAVVLGEMSYSLYMTHTLCQKVVYKLLPASRFEMLGPLPKIGILLIYAALVLIWCLCSYYLVEKPCRSLFRKSVNPTATPSSQMQLRV